MVNSNETSTAAEQASPRPPSRLFRALAWVGIVAGSIFVFGAVFFSGFFVAHGHMMGSHGNATSMPCCEGMDHHGHPGMNHHM